MSAHPPQTLITCDSGVPTNLKKQNINISVTSNWIDLYDAHTNTEHAKHQYKSTHNYKW